MNDPHSPVKSCGPEGGASVAKTDCWEEPKSQGVEEEERRGQERTGKDRKGQERTREDKSGEECSAWSGGASPGGSLQMSSFVLMCFSYTTASSGENRFEVKHVLQLTLNRSDLVTSSLRRSEVIISPAQEQRWKPGAQRSGLPACLQREAGAGMSNTSTSAARGFIYFSFNKHFFLVGISKLQ